VAVEQQPVTREVPVSGRLVFSNWAELTFDTSREVGEILVEEGERVEEGQVLARLDSLTMTALEEARAQAKLELEQAKDGLERARKAEFTGAPLEQAQFEEEVARAKKALTGAEEMLRDFQRNQQQELAAAMKAEADAELALDNARRALNNYDRDQVRELAAAKQLVADEELALKRSRENLANEDELTAFLLNNDVREGELIDVEILERLQASEAEARTNLKQAEDEMIWLTQTPWM
jgi:HlyD family secretion protein